MDEKADLKEENSMSLVAKVAAPRAGLLVYEYLARLEPCRFPSLPARDRAEL